MTTRKILLTVGLLAAVGIGFWAVKGWPPVGRGEQGAIGAANRYSAQQMSDADVVLGDDAVASLLQDDVFLELIADPDFQSLLAHSEAMDMLARGGTPELLAHQDPIAFLSRDDVADVLGRSDVQTLLRNQDFADLMGRSAVADGNGKGPKALDREQAIKDILARNNIELGAKGTAADGLGKNEIVKFLGREDVVQMLGRSDVQALSRAQGFADALGRSAVADGNGKGPKTLQRAEALKQLAAKNNVEMLGARGVPADALGKTAAVEFLSRNDVADVLGRSDVQTLLRNQDFADLMGRSAVADGNGKGPKALDREQAIKDILARNNIELGAKGTAADALGKNEIVKFLARDDVAQVLGRSDVQGLLRNDAFADALGRAGVADGNGKGPKTLDRATKIKELMAKSDVQMVGRSGVADGALGRQNLDKVKALMANAKVATLLSRSDVQDYFGRGNVKALMGRDDVKGLFRAENLASTLGRLQVGTQPGQVKDKGGK